MPRSAVLAPVVLALAACANTSSGVQPTGTPGLFTITERRSPLDGGVRAAERAAMAAAQTYCGDVNGQLVPATAQELDWPAQDALLGPTGFRLNFRCRAPDAPDPLDPEGGPPP